MLMRVASLTGAVLKFGDGEGPSHKRFGLSLWTASRTERGADFDIHVLRIMEEIAGVEVTPHERDRIVELFVSLSRCGQGIVEVVQVWKGSL